MTISASCEKIKMDKRVEKYWFSIYNNKLVWFYFNDFLRWKNEKNP